MHEQVDELVSSLRPVGEEHFGELKAGLEEAGNIISQLASTRFRHDMLVHELNATAVMAIRGGAARLAKHSRSAYPTDELVQKVARDLDKAIKYLVQVQEQDSAAARFLRGAKGRLSRRSEPLRWVIEECVDLFKEEAASKHLEIVVDPSIDLLPRIPISHETLRVAMGNVIGNAVKYSHSGAPGSQRRVEVYATPRRSASGSVTISVKNWGMGVVARDRGLIFWPYTRGTNYDQRRFIIGTGLGLYVAKEIVEQHGGTIDVWCSLFSQPQIDPTDRQYETRAWETKFTISLPVTEVF